MSNRLGWGILGTGLIAGIFADDLRIAGLNVAAVGSRSTTSALAFAHARGVPHAHGSYSALIGDPLVDIVYVATPNTFHREHALLAIRAGKHVLVEKPFALNASEAREIVSTASLADVAVMEAMWTRFLPHMIRVRELVAAGMLGDIRAVQADHGQVLPAAADHRVNAPELGGGSLLDLGIYPISFAVDLLGLPERVLAHSVMTSSGVDRQTAVIMVHPGGRHAISHSALDARSAIRASVIGTHARLELDPWWYNATGMTLFDQEGGVIEYFSSEVEGRGMQYQALELERVIEAGQRESALLPLAETVGIMSILDDVRAQAGLVFPGDLADDCSKDREHGPIQPRM